MIFKIQKLWTFHFMRIKFTSQTTRFSTTLYKPQPIVTQIERFRFPIEIGNLENVRLSLKKWWKPTFSKSGLTLCKAILRWTRIAQLSVLPLIFVFFLAKYFPKVYCKMATPFFVWGTRISRITRIENLFYSFCENGDAV